jgi:hypothetical protein
MSDDFSDSQLIAYLDEALPAEEMAAVEQALRKRPELLQHLTQVNARRDAGVHSLGDIWRRYRLTCANRSQLGSYLLGVLPDEVAGYLRFHIHTVGCRYCQANLADLESEQSRETDVASRRRKYFQSSAGYLGGK